MDCMFYIALFIVVGFYTTVYTFKHCIKEGDAVGYDFDLQPNEVIAVFVLWPIAIPLTLLIMHWPIKNTRSDNK